MESSTQIEERAAEWLARRDGDEWTDPDEGAFTRWLQESTAHRVAFLRLDAAWHHANRLKALGAGLKPGVIPPPGDWRHSPFFSQPLAAAQGSQQDFPAVQKRKEFRHPYRALAASVLIAVTLGVGWYLLPSGPSFRTAVGGLAAVPMSDGSRITLNTDSEVRVAVTETERRVDLEQGEAFFEVAKDPNRPFVVKAGNQRVVAVGTKFSVRRGGDSDDVLVVVTEGRVRVESARTTAPPIEITAGNVARSGDAGVLVQQKPLAEVEVLLSWRSGYLVFKDTTLADAVAEFNRYNISKIVIEDASVAVIRIGGNFRSTNVEAFVRLLEDGFPIRVEQRDQRIVLTKT